MSGAAVLPGRDVELARLRTVLLGTAPASALIIGEGGQGKTALAQSAFIDPAVVQAFGERRYWADVTGARSESEVLAVLAGALQVSSGAAIKSRILDQLADGPAMLVLKGVRIDEQSDMVSMDELARSLAHIGTLVWVVTSSHLRESFSVRWQEIIQLAPLDTVQATRAFVDMAGPAFEGDPRVGEIVEASGRVPAALELLARQAVHDGTLQPLCDRVRAADFTAADRGARTPAERALARALVLVVRDPYVGWSARTLLSATAMVPDGIATRDLHVLEDVMPQAQRELSLAGLLAASLDRCRVASAVAHHVRRLFPADQALVDAVDEIYLRLVEQRAPLAGQAGGDEAMATLAAELRNIESVLNRRLGLGSGRAATAAYHYGNFISHSGVGDTTLLERAREVAQADESWKLAADCALRCGDIALARFDHPRAEASCEAAAAEYRRINDLPGEAHCLRNLGVIALRTQRWTAAQAFFEQAVSVARSGGAPFAEAISIERLGDLAFAQDQHDVARSHYEDALRRYQHLENPREADCWLSLGDLALANGNEALARAHMEKALQLHRSAGHHLGVANSLMRLAQLESDAAPDRAEPAFREVLSMYRRLGNVRGEANTHLLLARLAARANRPTAASSLTREALSLYRSVKDLYGESLALSALAEAAAAEGRTDEAEAFEREAQTVLVQSQGADRSHT